MLSYAHGACDQPLLGETIGHNLARTVARVPDADALVSCHQGVRYTYAQFAEAVDRLAGGLLAAGLRKAERVGVWAPNRAEWALVQYATAKLGLILVNINPAYRRSELEYALGQSGCRWLFAAQECKGSDFVEMVDGVRGSLPGLERAVFFDTPEWDEVAAGGASPEQVRAAMDELDFDDPINIQYTSGTTGFPKGATLSHHNILNNGFFIGELLAYTERDRVCVPVPLYHCFGMVIGNLASTSHGACIVYPADTFEPEATLGACDRERCTSLYGVPTMFIAELGHERFERYDLTALRTGIMAGSPCPIEVMKRVSSEMGIDELGIAFGMTETSPVTTQVRRNDSLENRCGTVGQVMPHTEIKIVDPRSGRTLPRGEPGEFLARGYAVMRGYWNDPERTAEAIDSSRWMHTGDLATIDEQGYVRVVGRIKDMVIRGGENLYPREIEEFLYTHPEVADVQVIGVPDPRYGEELMAWIVLRPGSTASEETIREFCRGQIARHKVPRYVKFVDSFPLTVTGKVQKFKMREAAIEELGLGEAAAVATA
ncbi:MAG: AMP-binding protein [Solirubrobacterales bacterium]|nr:AMP-binding protein [Solirubrobacterales bacterium]MBV9472014.1 AMP-binding protein [Solirubrobacterales bacterium]